MRIFSIIPTIVLISIAFFVACDHNDHSEETIPEAICTKDPPERSDSHTPESMVGDWSNPVRIGEPINTYCPADAIEISADGQYLYYMFSSDLLENMTPAQILAKSNNTYRAKRISGPGEFDKPVYYDLGKGTDGSLDGELSFTSDGSKVYFHSNRAANTGYQANPTVIDILDIYIADIVNGEPQAGINLGPPVNSIYADGEHALYPDDHTLYFASRRYDDANNPDIWKSTFDGTSWTDPVKLGSNINTTFAELQPAFTPDGDTMYFTSDRNPLIGAAIYRSARNGDDWGVPQLVITGVVGEASLTADGQLMYFVHVLSDANGTFDSDVWYVERTR